MAHFSLVFCKASDSLAYRGLQQKSQKIKEHRVVEGLKGVKVQPLKAKQCRLSRPNTSEEIRKKRNNRRRRKRQEERKLSKKSLKMKLQQKFKHARQLESSRFTKEIICEKKKAEEKREMALHFWTNWRKEKARRQKDIQLHEIEGCNLKDVPEQDVLGSGVFGCCKKMLYRGNVVAVKFFNNKISVDAVKMEASMINTFDNEGLPYIFGINVKSKPYFIVMECYGIDGRTVTLAEAAKTSMFTTERQWVNVLLACAKAISQIHAKGYIHCDLKGDNIVINKVGEGFHPIVIDFGKMRKACEAKIKKLTTIEQEKYSKNHKHIAPEVVRGTHPPSKASDIYAFGLVISLICFYHRIENLRLIAVTCINGTPERRHTIDQIIDQLESL